MLFWKKKPNAELDLSYLGTDMHSHLVPGIDDGSQSMEESIALIREMAALGYKKIITTPHILGDMYPNTRDIILNGAEAIRKELQKQQIQIEFTAAAEYFIDDRFQQLLDQKTPLLTLKDNLVLVEFSIVTAPLDLQDVLFQMQMQNYQPVIAHPERYIYLRNNKQFFEDLKDSGALFQLNLLSLTNYYGTSVQELAGHLLKKGMYTYAGTDLHGQRHLDGLAKLVKSPLYPLFQNTAFNNSGL